MAASHVLRWSSRTTTGCCCVLVSLGRVSGHPGGFFRQSWCSLDVRAPETRFVFRTVMRTDRPAVTHRAEPAHPSVVHLERRAGRPDPGLPRRTRPHRHHLPGARCEITIVRGWSHRPTDGVAVMTALEALPPPHPARVPAKSTTRHDTHRCALLTLLDICSGLQSSLVRELPHRGSRGLVEARPLEAARRSPSASHSRSR